MLAFLLFPLGQDDSAAVNLKGLFDTGGCCNMGLKAYHMEIASKNPHLVKQVYDLQAIRHENIKIG